MDVYLTTTLDKLKSKNYRNLSLVLGNESCDLDSAVSAIVYAAFLYWEHVMIKCKVCTREHRDETSYRDDIFVPLLNVDRNDFELKTEVAYCLKEHGIDASKLVFRDDYDFEQLTSASKTTVTLVDHHVLAKKDRFLTPLVTEVIDHRPVDRSNWNYSDDTRYTIELVGSCCTLVTQRIRSVGALVSAEGDFFKAFPNATDMLLCGIILDTVNFSKEVNKATPVDVEMAEFLESSAQTASIEDERKSKLDSLVTARKDVSKLTAAQLLRKDVKIAGDILVPSFPILVEEFLSKPGALEAVSAAVTKHECSIALLLGMSLAGGLARDLAIYCRAPDGLAQQLAVHLQEWQHPPLQLSAQHSAIKEVLYFKQLNLGASRKQYMPALADFQISKQS
ncbi:hypothetical protein O0L34_g15820 [Tuta absoluta]|nr:hypothetical protein O0L34_g15820 [Tuta absoluta]